jgi:hypothetical protein
MLLHSSHAAHLILNSSKLLPAVDAVKLRIFFHIDKVIRKELGFKGLQ